MVRRGKARPRPFHVHLPGARGKEHVRRAPVERIPRRSPILSTVDLRSTWKRGDPPAKDRRGKVAQRVYVERIEVRRRGEGHPWKGFTVERVHRAHVERFKPEACKATVERIAHPRSTVERKRPAVSRVRASGARGKAGQAFHGRPLATSFPRVPERVPVESKAAGATWKGIAQRVPVERFSDAGTTWKGNPH